MPTLPATLPRPTTRSRFRASRAIIVLACVIAAAGAAQAQLFYDASEWKEAPAPAAPSFSQDKLIPLDMPTYSSLKFGVDPATIQVSPDGVVRYVVIATSREGGGFNAFYEGIHCAAGQYKTYARFSNGAWVAEKEPEWKPLGDRSSAYTRVLWKQGMCRDHATQQSAGETIRLLKAPIHDLD
jgi:CNP1-like family